MTVFKLQNKKENGKNWTEPIQLILAYIYWQQQQQFSVQFSTLKTLQIIDCSSPSSTLLFYTLCTSWLTHCKYCHFHIAPTFYSNLENTLTFQDDLYFFDVETKITDKIAKKLCIGSVCPGKDCLMQTKNLGNITVYCWFIYCPTRQQYIVRHRLSFFIVWKDYLGSTYFLTTFFINILS